MYSILLYIAITTILIKLCSSKSFYLFNQLDIVKNNKRNNKIDNKINKKHDKTNKIKVIKKSDDIINDNDDIIFDETIDKPVDDKQLSLNNKIIAIYQIVVSILNIILSKYILSLDYKNKFIQTLGIYAFSIYLLFNQLLKYLLKYLINKNESNELIEVSNNNNAINIFDSILNKSNTNIKIINNNMITIKQYDLNQLNSLFNNLFIEIFFVSYSFFVNKSYVSLFMTPMLSILGKFQSHLILIYIFRFPSIGYIKRPFESIFLTIIKKYLDLSKFDNKIDSTTEGKVDSTIDNEVDSKIDNENDNSIDKEVEIKIESKIVENVNEDSKSISKTTKKSKSTKLSNKKSKSKKESLDKEIVTEKPIGEVVPNDSPNNDLDTIVSSYESLDIEIEESGDTNQDDDIDEDIDNALDNIFKK